MTVATPDAIEARAAELAGASDRDAAVAELVALAGGDRAALEEARNRVSRHLHGNAGDWAATATLTLLNKALVSIGWTDKFDWKIRWTQPFKRP